MAKRKKEKSWLGKAAVLFVGLVFMFGALALLAACLSFHSADAGYNVANSFKVQNILGVFGAVSADWILNWFGLALPLFLVAPLVWGYEIIRYRAFIRLYGRFFAVVVGVFSLAPLLALVWGEVDGF